MIHILLKKAVRYKKRKMISAPSGYCFNNYLGVWVNKIDGALLVDSIHYPSCATKKEDIETGEDQKGE